MQMQTFIAEQEKTPMLCLNDQGGDRMDITEEVTSTLRAGMGGHPPLRGRVCRGGLVLPDAEAPHPAGAACRRAVRRRGVLPQSADCFPVNRRPIGKTYKAAAKRFVLRPFYMGSAADVPYPAAVAGRPKDRGRVRRR